MSYYVSLFSITKIDKIIRDSNVIKRSYFSDAKEKQNELISYSAEPIKASQKMLNASQKRSSLIPRFV
jgi:hypothetical protein